MNAPWSGISRRQGIVMAGVVTALLASGGVAAAAASADGGTAKHDGVTVSEAPGNPHPQHVKPGTAEELGDVTVGEGGPVTEEEPSVVEVPGAKPDKWEPAEATPVEGAPVVVGDEGNTDTPDTVTKPGH
ncbi:hypothetical protein AB0D57_30800 [Streptomyces sp. NPDC048275]|uniref:hypothetical protein n=1 Tax=Streptomyces sp. NPDC048275 TaxID=3155629 RepID=UPI0033F309B5